MSRTRGFRQGNTRLWRLLADSVGNKGFQLMFSTNTLPSGLAPASLHAPRRLSTHPLRNIPGGLRQPVASPEMKCLASSAARSLDVREDLTASSTEEEKAKDKQDLRNIPGIGLKYKALLVQKGIPTVEALTKTFYEDNNGSRDRMVGFLQASHFFLVSYKSGTPGDPRSSSMLFGQVI
jgi:hypothetical protein